jgi:RNA-binding protein 25
VSLNATRRLFVVDFLDYSEDKKAKKDGEKKSEESLKSQEEKKKHIKSLIEKIPTEKDALFAYQLDWTAIDNNLMERKIRPWINKKIIEYIGEPEPTLVDFICSKVLAGSQPQVILQDVQMVSVARVRRPCAILSSEFYVSGIRRRSGSFCC